MRILLADACSSVREMLSACCLMMGDRVEALYCVSDPAEAAYRAIDLDVDVVVIEIGPFLPGSPALDETRALDGVGAIRTLRRKGYRGRIVSYSSPAYDHLAVNAREAGSCTHLSKPFLLEEFMKSLCAEPVRFRRSPARANMRCAL